jgi:hypothetical protein
MTTRIRTRRPVETSEFVAFARRILAAMGNRTAGNADHLGDLAALSADVDAQLLRSVQAARQEGYSWAEIGSRLGVTRQAAQQRFSVKASLTVESTN